MTKEEINALALAEYNSEATTPHPIKGSGKPFWNVSSFQFLYVPAFQFNEIPGTKTYRYVITDANGSEHTFDADNCLASLAPVWKDIPEGTATLKVYALGADGNIACLAGARTFFKLYPFRTGLAPTDMTFREAALKAYDHAFNMSITQSWLKTGKPDPNQDRNVYPSKMIAATINAMIEYASICPERAGDAMRVATISADYLINCTPGEDSPMCGIPLTYQIDFRSEPEKRNNLQAGPRLNTVMMIYPATVARAYLNLEKATGDKKYFDAANKIAEFFKKTVEENGSWFLVRDLKTGEPIGRNYCLPLQEIVPMCMMMYERTGDEEYKKLADGAIAYVEKKVLPAYNWEAQFEDSSASANYSNLSHYGADALIQYYCRYFPNDEKKMAVADDLMRYVEDQFVIWQHPSPWNKSAFDTSDWPTPCGCEQYDWHVPIDASTADIALTFLAMYRAGRGEIHLEKARTLMRSIINVMTPDGLIPTHWMTPNHRRGSGFWINCMFFSTNIMAEFPED